MGKIGGQPPVDEAQLQTPQSPCSSFFSECISKISRAFSFRCFLVLILTACVCLSWIVWLPPFHPFGSGADQERLHKISVPVKASFKLQRPVSLLADNIQRLEYDIFEDIGVPNTKVSIISLNSSATFNQTNVVFGVLPDPSNTIIPSVDLSLLRSSLTELVLSRYKLSLTLSVFGHPSSFEVLKFPGGITVVPAQPFSFFLVPDILFNFTLNNSVSQIQYNLGQLKNELKYGLLLRPYENVFVQITNLEGSTLDPPVIVQASVFSDDGDPYLLPQRLKQLAEAVTGSPTRNLGLDHAVFGKVNQIQLSSYLQHSLGRSPSSSPSPSPSPLPSPTPSPSTPYPSPSMSSREKSSAAPPVSPHTSLPPSNVPSPVSDPHHLSPCVNCDASSPYWSPFPCAPTPKNGPHFHSPLPPLSSPGPLVGTTVHSPVYSPFPVPTVSPSLSPKPLPDSSAPPGFQMHSTSSPPHVQPFSSQLAPTVLSPDAVPHSPNHREDGSRNFSALSPLSPSPTSSVAGRLRKIWLIGLLGLLIFDLLSLHQC